MRPTFDDWRTPAEEEEAASIAERWLAAAERVAANLTVCAVALGTLAVLYVVNTLVDLYWAFQ